MMRKFFTSLHRRWQLRSLSAKLLLPIGGLMLISLLGSTLAFLGGTALTQNRLLGQQIAADAQRVSEALAVRADTVTTAATLLANDPHVVEAVELDTEEGLRTLNNRAVVVRDRFGLDLIQIYDLRGQARTNLVISSLYRESSMLDQVAAGRPVVKAVDDRVLLLSRAEISTGSGTVIVGIDLETALGRIVSEYRLPSDVGMRVDGVEVATRPDFPFDTPAGTSQGYYTRNLPLVLGATPVDLTLVRSTGDVTHVTRTGLLVMVGSTLLTTAFLLGLSVLITRAIAQPIQHLSGAAESLAAGDLSQRVDVEALVAPFGIGHEDEIGLLAGAFNDMVADLASLYGDLEARVEARTHELATSAEIARSVTYSLELDVVLERSVELIRERLGFYHVAIFLVEPDSNVAVYTRGTGVPGRMLREDEFRLTVGSKSLVGLAAATHCPRVVQDVEADPAYHPVSLLPATRSEVAIPLLIEKVVIGVLDIQSAEQGAFTPEMVELLRALADQIATGIHNAQLYARQRETAEHLAEVDEMKTQFLANMSHELRTPLNSIIGFSKVLLKEISGPLNEAQASDLEIIYRSGQHLLALINDILDITRINAGKLKLTLRQVDLDDVIADVLEATSALIADKEITLSADIARELPTIRADARRVRQILFNLLSNAAKFTESGEITVRAKAVEALNTYTGQVEPFVEVSITDTGIGIPEEMQVDIFREFTQVENSDSRRFEGAGLGLPITKKLVELHGGRIWVESNVGQGSTFTFILPVAPPEPSALLMLEEAEVDPDTPERSC
jgi:signal transduction histidine kinase